MKINNKQLLTKDQQIELRHWEQLFDSPGWSLVVQNAQEQIDAEELALVTSVSTMEELYRARGRLEVLRTIVNMSKSQESYFTALSDDAALARDELEDSYGANS